jgi:GNAT superfamily N-acetyltransferase
MNEKPGTYKRNSPTAFEIRLAGPADAAAIAEVLQLAFSEYKTLYTEGGFAATVLTPDEVIRRMGEGPVWVSLRDGTVAATVAAVVKGQSVYIRGMAAIPAARGCGVGTALLRCVENWAQSQGCTRLFLSTTPFLDSAIRLYENYGFRRTDEGQHDLCGTPLFTMEKICPPRQADQVLASR